MTGTELSTKLRVRLADSDDISFSDAEILEYINEGCADLASAGCCQYKEAVAFSSAYTANLASVLTYNYIIVPHVDIDGLPMDFAPLHERVTFSTDTGIPTAWTLWGDLLHINATYTGSVNVWYTYQPEEIDALSENIPLPERWMRGLLSYCEFRCRAQEGDAGTSAAEAEYNAIKATAADTNRAMMATGGIA